jgi:hypothetical protein
MLFFARLLIMAFADYAAPFIMVYPPGRNTIFSVSLFRLEGPTTDGNEPGRSWLRAIEASPVRQ